MTNRKICGKILGSIFKVPFKKTTINGHTLDFYNKYLKIGLLYNSIHRYEYSYKFHKTRRHFLFYENEPKLCCEACLEMEIKLIVVPYNSLCVLRSINKGLGIPKNCNCRRCDPFDKHRKCREYKSKG